MGEKEKEMKKMMKDCMRRHSFFPSFLKVHAMILHSLRNPYNLIKFPKVYKYHAIINNVFLLV